MSEDIHVSLKTYAGIFIALLVLLVVTVAVAYIDLGAFNLPIAMLIATIKASFIVLYFMHVKYSPRLIAILFGSSLYILLIGALLMFSDYMMR